MLQPLITLALAQARQDDLRREIRSAGFASQAARAAERRQLRAERRAQHLAWVRPRRLVSLRAR
jgi:hypothetical protein